MKILHDRVLAVDNELKKFHVDWMKAQIITELWKLEIKRAQKLAVFLHFESSSVDEAKTRLSIKRLRTKGQEGLRKTKQQKEVI